MRHILLHPTHKKFIRLLRSRIKEGYPIIFTQSDLDAYHAISQGTMHMVERHQKIYRLVLSAVFRPIEEIDKTEKILVVGNDCINVIEKCFAQAERHHLGLTILSGYIVPALQKIVNHRKKRNKR